MIREDRSDQMEDRYELLHYLHECDEQEKGVGGPSDLFVQEAGQKGEHPVFGSTERGKNKTT